MLRNSVVIALLSMCVLVGNGRRLEASAREPSTEPRDSMPQLHAAARLQSRGGLDLVVGRRCSAMKCLSQILLAVVPASSPMHRLMSVSIPRGVVQREASMDNQDIFSHSVLKAEASQIPFDRASTLSISPHSPTFCGPQMLADFNLDYDDSLLPRDPALCVQERISDAASVALLVDQYGGSTSGAKLVEAPGMGIGVVAARPSKKGDALLTVPLSLGLSTDRTLRSSIGARLSEFYPLLGDYAFIALGLMHERRLGSESELAPWLSSPSLLPMNGFSDLPLVWGEDGISILESATTVGATKRLESAIADFAWLEEYVFNADPITFPPFVFTRDAYIAAVALAISRAVPVTIEENVVQPILLPLLDFFNHDGKYPTASVKSQLASQGGFFVKKDSPACVSIVATVDVDAGAALSLSYGSAASPGELLLDQGFVAEPCESVVSATFEIDPDDVNFDEKAEVLEQAGLQTEETWSFRDSEPVPPDLMAFLRLKHLKGVDSFLLEAVFLDVLWDQHIFLPVSEENERDALNELFRFSERDNEFSSSNQKDLLTLAEADRSSRKYRLAAVRYAERRVLNSLNLYVQDLLSNMRNLEYYQERRIKSFGFTPVESDADLEALKASLSGDD